MNLFFPIAFLLICFYITFIIFISHTTDFLLSLITYFIGLLGYLLFVKCNKPKNVQTKLGKSKICNINKYFDILLKLNFFFFLDKITFAAQRLTLSVFQQKEE